MKKAIIIFLCVAGAAWAAVTQIPTTDEGGGVFRVGITDQGGGVWTVDTTAASPGYPPSGVKAQVLYAVSTDETAAGNFTNHVSGAPLYDIIQHTGANVPTRTTYEDRGVLAFDGVDDFIEATNSASWRTASDFTVSAWVFPYAIDDNHRIMWDGGALESNINQNVYIASASSNIVFSMGNGAALVSVTSSNVISINEWTHLVYGISGTTMFLYKDAVLAQTNVTFTGTRQTGAWTVKFGEMDSGASSDWFDGSIDSISYWQEALSASEIQTVYDYELTNHPAFPQFDYTTVWLAMNTETNADGLVPDTSYVGTNHWTLGAGGQLPVYSNAANGWYFDGSDQMELSNRPDIEYSIEGYTFSSWLKAESVTGNRPYFVRRDGVSANRVFLYRLTDLNPYAEWRSNNVVKATSTISANAEFLNNWRNMMVGYSPNGIGNPITWIDGEQRAGAHGGSCVKWEQNAVPARLGWNLQGGTYWLGNIDDVIIWQKKLTFIESKAVFGMGH